MGRTDTIREVISLAGNLDLGDPYQRYIRSAAVAGRVALFGNRVASNIFQSQAVARGIMTGQVPGHELDDRVRLRHGICDLLVTPDISQRPQFPIVDAVLVERGLARMLQIERDLGAEPEIVQLITGRMAQEDVDLRIISDEDMDSPEVADWIKAGANFALLGPSAQRTFDELYIEQISEDGRTTGQRFVTREEDPDLLDQAAAAFGHAQANASQGFIQTRAVIRHIAEQVASA
jgi:hypothetical protein